MRYAVPLTSNILNLKQHELFMKNKPILPIIGNQVVTGVCLFVFGIIFTNLLFRITSACIGQGWRLDDGSTGAAAFIGVIVGIAINVRHFIKDDD
jgi:hypothetical protein